MQKDVKGFKDILGFWKNLEGQGKDTNKPGVKKDLAGKPFAEQEDHLKPGGAGEKSMVPEQEAPETESSELAETLPGKAFTHDNNLSLQVDSVCDGGFPAIFGITPAALETVVPVYLSHRDQRGRYDEYRQRARHHY